MSRCGTQSAVRRHNERLVPQVTVSRCTMTAPAGPFSSKFPLNGSSIIRRTRTRGPKWQDRPAPVKRDWRDALQPQASSLDARLSLANGVSEALGRQSVSATAGRMNAPAWKAKLGGGSSLRSGYNVSAGGRIGTPDALTVGTIAFPYRGAAIHPQPAAGRPCAVKAGDVTSTAEKRREWG